MVMEDNLHIMDFTMKAIFMKVYTKVEAKNSIQIMVFTMENTTITKRMGMVFIIIINRVKNLNYMKVNGKMVDSMEKDK